MRGEEDEALIRSDLTDFDILGFFPEMPEIAEADRNGVRPFENIDDAPDSLHRLAERLLSISQAK